MKLNPTYLLRVTRTALFFLLFLFCYQNINAQSYRWATKATSSGDDVTNGLTLDNTGNYYASGRFSGTLNFDSAGFPRTLTSAGGVDLYIAKFDCNRNLMWANRIGGTSVDAGAFGYTTIKYDQLGNLYMTGTFKGTATFTNQTGISQVLTSTGDNDIFLAKYDTSGGLIWTVKSGSIGTDEATSLTIDHSGNIVTAGFFTNTATWGATSGPTIAYSSSGTSDLFIAKYTPAGQLIWVTRGSGAGEEIADDVCVDQQNSIYLTGNFGCCGSATANFGSKTITNNGGWGGFLAKMDSNGVWSWVNGLGGAASEAGAACAVDDFGNVYFSGHYDQATTISSQSPGSSIALPNVGGYDIFLAKYDTAGVLSWAKSIGGPGQDYNYDLCLNERNNIVITGGFSNTANFSGINLTSSGGTDIYVSEYTKSGNIVQCIKGGGTGINESGLIMVNDTKGALYLGGYYTGSATFGSQTLTGLGGFEAFVAKLSLGFSFTLNQSPATAFCPGNNVTLRSTTILPTNSTYKWLKDGTIVPSETRDSLIVNTAGSYQLIATSICNESDTSQIIVVAPFTTPPFPISDKTVCLGDSVQLVSGGGTTYSWSPSTGLSNPNIANPYAKPTSNQQYIVTISNGSCSVKDTILVNVNTNCCFNCTVPSSSINTGLVACYPFNGNALDESNNGNNGTAAATAILTTNRKNQASKAFVFDGSSTSEINIPASPSLNVNTMSSFTYACWFNASAFSTLPTHRRIFCIQDPTNKNIDLSYDYSTNKLNFINYNGTSNVIDLISKATFTLNTWYHVALVIDATNKPQLYVNGVLDTFSTINVLRPVLPAYAIGNHVFNNWSFAGKIDDVRVYNRALSAAELMQLTTQLDPVIIVPITDKTVCQGDSVQLIATGGTSYSWSPTTGLSNPNIANPFAKPTTNQQYIVTVSNGVCSVNDTVMVNVSNNCCATCTTITTLNTGLQACFPFNGNPNDETGNGHNGTIIGGATLTSDRFGNANSAYSFNGTTAAITIPYHSAFNFAPTGQFSIALWAKPGAANQPSGALFVKSPFNSNVFLALWDYGLYHLVTKAMGGYANNSVVQSTSSFLANTWYHIAVTYNNGKWECYVNGVLEATDYSQTKFITQSSSGISIGKKGEANGDYYNGAIDDIRIYNRALSAQEMGELFVLKPARIPSLTQKTFCQGDSVQLSATGGTSYSWSPSTGLSNPNIANPYAKPTTNQQYLVTISNTTCSFTDTVMVTVNNNCCGSCIATLPLNTGVMACYPFTGNTNDETTLNGAGTNNNATLTTDRFGNANSAYTFGTSKTISIPATNLTTNNYTYSSWVKLTSLPTAGNAYCIMGVGGSSIGDQVILVANNYSGGQTGFTATSYRTPVNPSGPDRVSTGALPTINIWYHIAQIRDVANNKLKLYVNGVKVAEAVLTATTAAYDLPAQGLIGARAPGNIQYFNGSIDDVRIFNRVLSDAEISILYNIPNQTPFIPNAGTDRNICLGDSVQLAASGGTTYLWNASTGLSSLGIPNPYAKPADSTKYYVTISTAICSAPDSVMVNVNKITVDAGVDQTICFRDSIQLHATKTAGATYTWTPAISLNNASIDSPYAKPSDTTLYKVTATLNGCSAKDSVTINVKKVLADAGTNQSICIGDSIQLNASGGTSYAWNQNSSLSDTAIQNPYAKPGLTTKYFVTVKDGLCSNIDSVTISLGSLLTLNAGVDTSICLGDSVRLLATGATSYTWSSAATLSDSTIANPYAKPSDTTVYYVTGTTGTCSATDTVKVNVKKITLNAGVTQTICKGDSIQLNATGTLGSAFNWTSSTFLNNLLIANPYAKPSDTTVFYVNALLNGCSLQDSVKINVRSIPADAGAGKSICLGDSVQLSAIGGTAYTWNNDPTLSSLVVSNPYAKPVTSTMYYVTVTDGTCSNTDSVEVTLTNTINLNAGSDTSACSGDSVQLSATGTATTFTWTPALGLNNATIANPKASPVTTTDYIVRAQAGVCYDLDTIKVTVNTSPFVDLGPDTTKCKDQPYLFSPLVSNADRYSWQPASEVNDATLIDPFTTTNIAQTFILTVTNSTTGCKSSDSVFVNVQTPVAEFSLAQTSGPVPFTATPHNTSHPQPLTYNWEMMDTVSAFYTSAEPTHVFAKPGIYTIFLTVTDDRGCIDTVSQTIDLTSEVTLFVPNVFTPNGDGLNDLFEIGFAPGSILGMKGSIWNRWGAKIHEFGTPDYIWWDGKAGGQTASDGVYYYIIEIVNLQNEVLHFNGTITLLR